MQLDGLPLEIVAGTSAGVAATIIGHPLDCIKVRLQALQRPGLTTLGCAVEMLKTDGARAFFRGLGPPLVEKVLASTLMFVAFEEARRRLPDTAFGSLLAGAFSGLATSILSTPTDWVKIQAQVRGVPVRRVLTDVLRGGALRALPRTLYLGHCMNMLRETVFTAVYLGFYAELRAAIVAAPPSGGDAAASSTAPPPLHLVALASATTGALAWAAAYPFDSIKSVQQAQPAHKPSERASPLGAARSLWAQGGIESFYRGLYASTFRAILVTCSRLFTYEAIKGVFAS